MKTTTEIRLDVKYPALTPPVHAKQNDQLTRYIKAYLYDGGTPFVPPGDVLAVVRAKKPDKTVCFYDANEANEPAVVLEENTATVLLAHQVLAAAGTVQMEISLYTPAASVTSCTAPCTSFAASSTWAICSVRML